VVCGAEVPERLSWKRHDRRVWFCSPEHYLGFVTDGGHEKYSLDVAEGVE